MKKQYSIWISALVFTFVYSCQPKSTETSEAAVEEVVEESAPETIDDAQAAASEEGKNE